MENKELSDLRKQCSKLEKQMKKHLQNTVEVMLAVLETIEENPDKPVHIITPIATALGVQTRKVFNILNDSSLSVEEVVKSIKKLNKNTVIKVKDK